MLQNEQDWENITKVHPFSWELKSTILTQQGALPPGSGQSLPFLGFDLCRHTLLLGQERSGCCGQMSQVIGDNRGQGKLAE